MGKREERAHEAASMYYLQNKTMEAIATHLGTSRSSVSRLLAYARDIGLVRVTLQPLPNAPSSLAGRISTRFHVNAHVIPVGTRATDIHALREVSRVAAAHLVDISDHDTIMGIAWGNTMNEVSVNLPQAGGHAATIVQLNGATMATEAGAPWAGTVLERFSKSFGARALQFPVPAFFDYATTKEAMWRERSVRSVLSTIARCNIAVFGVGSMSSRLPSLVYSGGFLTHKEILAARADGLVGDVCTVLMRADGSTDTALNDRASGPTPSTLRSIPRRVCVAAGSFKALPLLGALRAGVVTDLFLDDGAARELLALSDH